MSFVGYTIEDRQWDARFNCIEDEYLERIVSNIQSEWDKGKFKYVLVSGAEIGTRPQQDDYGVRHIHVAVIFVNRASKASIIKNWGIVEGCGYYLVPRNRDLPYSGWRSHHLKEFSKIDKSKTCIIERGELPRDAAVKTVQKRSAEEKKDGTDEVIRKLRKLIEDGKDDEAFERFPRNFIMYGERIRTMVKQRLRDDGRPCDPHIWLYGFPGTGKTAIMRYVYPLMYKKDLNNRFFDLYDDKVNTHIMLEDLDHQNVEKLGIQFLKTLCDEAGFPIDQKYKTPQMTKSTILVTSNFTIVDVVPEGKGVDETKAALSRRFLQMRVDQAYRMLGLKLVSKYERSILKKTGNNDPGKVLIDWNWVLDCPTGLPIKKPEEYQQRIRDMYYG